MNMLNNKTADCEKVVILLAEDDDGHARLVAERLADAGVRNPVVRFRDGGEA